MLERLRFYLGRFTAAPRWWILTPAGFVLPTLYYILTNIYTFRFCWLSFINNNKKYFQMLQLQGTYNILSLAAVGDSSNIFLLLVLLVLWLISSPVAAAPGWEIIYFYVCCCSSGGFQQYKFNRLLLIIQLLLRLTIKIINWFF